MLSKAMEGLLYEHYTGMMGNQALVHAPYHQMLIQPALMMIHGFVASLPQFPMVMIKPVESGKYLNHEMELLDETWHMIRRAVEGGEFGRGCTGARCSTAFKPDTISPKSNGVITVATTNEGKNESWNDAMFKR